MKSNEEIQLISISDKLWMDIKTHIDEVKNFLTTKICTDNTPILLHVALRIVISELLLEADKYEAYSAQLYEEEDFVDMVIESIVYKWPSEKEEVKSKKYIEDIRKIMWGHIKKHYALMTDLVIRINDDSWTVSDKNMNLMIECLTVVYVECLIRDRELRFLEQMNL